MVGQELIFDVPSFISSHATVRDTHHESPVPTGCECLKSEQHGHDEDTQTLGCLKDQSQFSLNVMDSLGTCQ